MVDKQTYFARLDELKVFSATELFFLGSGCKNATATINIDLRPFLEMYLMNRIVSTNEYEDIEQNLERLNEQKRTFQKMSKVLTSIEKDFTAEVEVRKQKAKAVRNIDIYFHFKEFSCNFYISRNKVNEICFSYNYFTITKFLS